MEFTSETTGNIDRMSPRTVDTGRGLNVLYKNRNLYSPTDPEGRAELNAEKIRVSGNTLLIVPSPLLGYGLKTLIGKLQQSCHILCIETDQNLMALSLEYIPHELLHHEKISFIRTDDPFKAVEYLHRKQLLHVRKIQYIPLSSGYSLSPDTYRSIRDTIEKEIQRYWRNRMTLIHMGRLWMRNIMANLPLLCEGQNLSCLHTDKPVVVAGAGESLEAANQWILEARKDVYLLAADTALGSLKAFGLVPDLVIALEGQSANLTDFIGSHDDEFDLATDIASYPGITRRFRGRTWFFSSSFADISLLRRLAARDILPRTMPPLGSVGIAALYCALSISNKPVFITGLDFAFALGKPHARHTPSHIRHLTHCSRLVPSPLYRLSKNRPYLPRQGKRGTVTGTDNVLLSYAQDAIELIRMNQGRVYDTGLPGIPLGLEPVDDKNLILRLIGEARGSGNVNAEDTSRKPLEEKKEALRMFLEQEEKLLTGFTAAARRVLEQSDGSEELSQAPELDSLLKDLDYLYLDFPDPPPLPAYTRSFIWRTLTAACYYLLRVRMSLEALESGAAET